jgi:hypothetical protein
LDFGSDLSSSGTNPAGFASAASADMRLSIPYAFGIFICAKDKPKPPVAEGIARAHDQNGRSSSGLLMAFFADSLPSLRSKLRSFLIYWVPKMATQGWGSHCWWGLPGGGKSCLTRRQQSSILNLKHEIEGDVTLKEALRTTAQDVGATKERASL